MTAVIICTSGLGNAACFSNIVCFSESSSDHLNPIGHVCFKKKLGYFLVVKIQSTEMNVSTERCCSLALHVMQLCVDAALFENMLFL